MGPILEPKIAPYIVAQDAAALADFIVRGIGGSLSSKVEGKSGKIVHAEVRVADGYVMIGEAPPDRPPFPAMIHVYVENTDIAFERAIAEGASEVRSPGDTPDGFRRGGVKDRWGNEWWFTSSTPKH